jgi:hypothetical protein
MKNLQSFGALARALERSSQRLAADLAVTMEKCAVVVELAAKAEIGHYQTEDMGPFSVWAPLAPSTVAEKRRNGYASDGNDNPLLRTGEMRDSIEHEAGFRQFTVGSKDEVLVYQEIGTPTIPPRPALAPALYRNVKTILHEVGKTIEKNIAGET